MPYPFRCEVGLSPCFERLNLDKACLLLHMIVLIKSGLCSRVLPNKNTEQAIVPSRASYTIGKLGCSKICSS
jgi:hypothetical protein